MTAQPFICRSAVGCSPTLPNLCTGQGINFRYLLVLRTSQQLAVSECLPESAAIHTDTSSRLYANTAKALHTRCTKQDTQNKPCKKLDTQNKIHKTSPAHNKPCTKDTQNKAVLKPSTDVWLYLAGLMYLTQWEKHTFDECMSKCYPTDVYDLAGSTAASCTGHPCCPCIHMAHLLHACMIDACMR